MKEIRAKLFKNGGSQALRLPKAFRFSGTEVTLTRDDTGTVTISPVDDGTWESFFARRDAVPGLRDEPFERIGNEPIVFRDLF